MTRPPLSMMPLLTVYLLFASANASAATFPLPQILPMKAGGAVFTASSDGTEELSLETSHLETVKCKGATAQGGQVTTSSGTFTIATQSCKESVFSTTCMSTGDSTGVILSSGSFHYVTDTLGATLGANGVAVLLLEAPTEFGCDGGLTNFKITGTLLCQLLEPLVLRRTHLFHCVQNAGAQIEKTYWNGNGTLVTASLLLAKNSGTAEQAGLLALAQGTAPEAVAIMNE